MEDKENKNQEKIEESYNDYQNYNNPNKDMNGYMFHSSKVKLGVLFAFIFNFVGLIIGLCMYSAGVYERKTFIKGWGMTYLVVIGICLFAGLISLIF